MPERNLSRRDFIFGVGALALGASLGTSNPEASQNDTYLDILRKATDIDTLIHNAEKRQGYDTQPNDAHFLEIDIMSMNGIATIGHSDTEVTYIPSDLEDLSDTFKRIVANGSNVHIDLKDPDTDIGRNVYKILPKGSFISTPHHEVLDALRDMGGDTKLLYTINSSSKKKDFASRIRSGEDFTNCGVSIHYSLLSDSDVKSYQDSQLYVLAYPANRLDVAAQLCEYGVNGITSDREDLLSLIAQR